MKASIERKTVVSYQGTDYTITGEYDYETEEVFDDGDDECPPSVPEFEWGDARILSIQLPWNGWVINNPIDESLWNPGLIKEWRRIGYLPEMEVMNYLRERRNEPNELL